MHYLIKNGSIIDPAQRVISFGHILVEDGKVSAVFDLAQPTSDIEARNDLQVIHAQGCIVAPGFTDIHTHLCEPGEEHRETIATGTQAAAHGGFTTVCMMPNTIPVIDRVEMVHQVQQRTRKAHIQVDVIGALTMGCEGNLLTEMTEMVKAGCIAFSDGNNPIVNPMVMRHALSYANVLGIPIMSHCEEKRLNQGWAMHEGEVSTRLGLPGYPASAEEAQIARDIALAEMTGAHLHICHISTAGSVRLIREAKKRGVRVTATVTPHHLTLTDRWVLGPMVLQDDQQIKKPKKSADGKKKKSSKGYDTELRSPLSLDPAFLLPYDTNTRVNPPLRSQRDVEALIEGLCDDTIDAIATDHTPYPLSAKACEYGRAVCGISGLETALGLVLALVNVGALDLMNVVAKLTEGPAQILGRSPSTLRPGYRADIVIFDAEQSWTVDTKRFISKGKNNPLHDQQLKGQIMLTMAGGHIVFRRDDFGKESHGRPKASVLSGILNNGEESDDGKYM